MANASDLDLCTEHPIPLIPKSWAGDNKSVTLSLWKGSMANYTGMYLFRLDTDLNVLNVTAL